MTENMKACMNKPWQSCSCFIQAPTSQISSSLGSTLNQTIKFLLIYTYFSLLPPFFIYLTGKFNVFCCLVKVYQIWENYSKGTKNYWVALWENVGFGVFFVLDPHVWQKCQWLCGTDFQPSSLACPQISWKLITKELQHPSNDCESFSHHLKR